MSIEWQDLLTGVGLMLVFEGIFPFISPLLWRKWLIQIISQPNQVIRGMGLLSMSIGALVIYLIH